MKLQPYNIKDIPKLNAVAGFDGHLKAKHEHPDVRKLVNLILPELGGTIYWNYTKYSLKDTYLPGDDLEFKNTRYKYLKDQYKLRDQLISKLGENFWDGNHGPKPKKPKEYNYFHRIVRGNHLIIHGSEIWGEEKAIDYQDKKDGCGWFKYHITSQIINSGRGLFPVRPKEKHLENIIDIHEGIIYPNITQGPTIKYIHFGHTHIKEITAVKYKDIVFIYYPQGVFEI